MLVGEMFSGRQPTFSLSDIVFAKTYTTTLKNILKSEMVYNWRPPEQDKLEDSVNITKCTLQLWQRTVFTGKFRHTLVIAMNYFTNH